ETTLQFYNTLTRSKRPLQPLAPPRVSVFTCGPTVDNRIHIGQCRRFILADLLCRYLEYKAYDVTHIMNITDLDDKTIQASEKAGIDIRAFTDSHFRAFLDDMEALGVKPATRYARASDHIEEMIALTSKLLEKGFAYEKLQSVYFDISRFAGYGKLSGVDLNKIRLGSTVDLDEYEKDNPRDFTLLKRAKLSELRRGIYTKTEWGNVRPSWHIQSVAIAMKYLGCPFDIYTSSKDLLFPHHENEIAISGAATGSVLANCWIHTELVLSQGKKAEAGPGVPYVRDLLDKGYSGRAIRYWMLSHNHRKPLPFSYKALDQAAGALKRLDECVHRLADVEQTGPAYAELDQLLYDLKTEFTDALDDDLDISRAMASIFRQVRKINRLLTDGRIDKTAAKRIIQALSRINDVVNLFSFEQPSLDTHIEQLIRQRQEARRNQNWALADKIREQLKALGVQPRDTKISG
ncbi:MAG: cysteine--tRNA ligase, partial [Deltaproteobacteria bacterium]|nr:cysteine--tRNA ligase [Deltaproteobacteria bacterium]